MFCKIFKHGRGRASGIDYLMSIKDAKSNQRMPPPRLMRGNISLTKKLIHISKFAQKYTSGVLSWAESTDQISQTTLNEVMDSFEQMLGAGLANDCLNWLWVLHRDKGRIEMHWIVPNLELVTGKRFAPYFDRFDRPRFRAWERLTNRIHHFADPSDPSRRKDLSLPSNLPCNKVEAVQSIHNVITALVNQKLVNNRDDIILELKKAGYLINREGKDYLSIVDSKGQKLRLRGAYYESDFIVNNHVQMIINKKEFSEKAIQNLQDEFTRQTQKRLNYIRSRYLTSQSNDVTGHFPYINPNLFKLNVSDSHISTAESEELNGSTRKFAERDIKSDGGSSQQTIPGINNSINAFGHTTSTFYKSLQYFIERVGRSVKHLKATTSNRFTY